jgi:ABC-type branched-subunit amino acid transport system permease subunit
MRAIGGDRRASRVVGVRVERTLVGLFTVSGSLAAIGGALLSYSFSSANPDPGLQPLILGQIVAIAALPGYCTGLLYAALLAVMVVIDAPGLRQALDRVRARTRDMPAARLAG